MELLLLRRRTQLIEGIILNSACSTISLWDWACSAVIRSNGLTFRFQSARTLLVNPPLRFGDALC